MSAYQKSVWLGDLMRYRNLEKLWVGIRADPSTVSVAVPRTTETVGIGRADQPGLVAFRVRERRVRACGHKGYGEVDTGLKIFRHTSGIGPYYRKSSASQFDAGLFRWGQFNRRS